MTIDDRQEIAKRIFEICLKVLRRKGKDYAGNDDSLANFKRNAQRLGLSKYQIWAVYWNKHVDSINNAIKSNPTTPQVESEPIESRVVDLINYEIILQALLIEDEEKKDTPHK